MLVDTLRHRLIHKAIKPILRVPLAVTTGCKYLQC